MALQTIHLSGEPYVVLPQAEYDRLTTLAKAAELPPLPAPDRSGHVPAVEYARASLARKIIQARSAAGLSQQELARRAGIRIETVCRLERGKHTPGLATLAKIEQALAPAATAKRRRKKLS